MIARVKGWAKSLGIILASFVPALIHAIFVGPVLWGTRAPRRSTGLSACGFW